MRSLSRSLVSISLGLSLVLSTGCSLFPCRTCSKEVRDDNQKGYVRFKLLQAESPQVIWNPKTSEIVKKVLKDYYGHMRLPNNLFYGDSVRNFSLASRTADQIDSVMTELECKKKNEFILNPKTRKPVLDEFGKKVPLTVYLCPDGGVVRIKPHGDPTSRYRPQPHGNKSLRYPYNSQFKTFDDEVVKVDNQGKLVPKWVKDLNPVFREDPEIAKEIIRGWADDAHTDLPLEAVPQ